MSNYFNPENQYLEQGMFEGGDFEDMEYGGYQGEGEQNWEGLDHEDGEYAYERDEFLGALKSGFNFAKPFLRPLAMQAAQHLGGKLAGAQGAQLAKAIAGRALREGDHEGLYESESDPETLLQEMGGDMEIYNEMAHYATLAANTENDHERDYFIGAIANLAGTLLPKLLGETDQEYLGESEGDGEAYYEDESYYEGEGERDEFLPLLLPLAAKALPMAMKAAPLIRTGIKALGSLFGKKRRSREALQLLPQIAATTAVQVARQARAGRPITRQRVVSTMVRNTARPLASPRRTQLAIRRTRYAARRARQYHVTVRPLSRRRYSY